MFSNEDIDRRVDENCNFAICNPANYGYLIYFSRQEIYIRKRRKEGRNLQSAKLQKVEDFFYLVSFFQGKKYIYIYTGKMRYIS
jgi:hypothetical protein